jgi:hypothetical protein
MVLGQDAFQAGSRDLDRGHRLVDQLADAKVLGLGLKVRPARLLRHSEQLSARYNSSGSSPAAASSAVPLNVHPSNYVRHVGLVLE